LSEAQQERLMTALLGKDRSGALGDRVRIVGEEIYDSQGVEQKEWITRTMIKKAFKDAKQ
jgi:Trp operon repressor